MFPCKLKVRLKLQDLRYNVKEAFEDYQLAVEMGESEVVQDLIFRKFIEAEIEYEKFYNKILNGELFFYE